MNLRIDFTRIPGKAQSEREIVEHRGSVVILPLYNNDTVIFIRQWRRAPEKITLELPSGTLDAGEPPLQAAARELREETGFEAQRLKLLGGFWVAPGYATEYTYAFVGYNLIRNPLPQDEAEDIKLAPYPLSAINTLIINRELEDQMTLATLSLYSYLKP